MESGEDRALVIEMFTIPEALEPSFVDMLSDEDLFGIKGIWQLSYRDLRTRRITIGDENDLSQFTFNDDTVFPPALTDLAGKVMEEGKCSGSHTIGQLVRKFYERGHLGKK